MADLTLCRRVEFAKCEVETLRNKQRIVAKTARSTRFESDMSIAKTVCLEQYFALGIGYGNRADEPCRAIGIARSLDLIEQKMHFFFETEMIAAVPRRIDAGSSVEGFYLEARVVGERKLSRLFRITCGFEYGVFAECFPGFGYLCKTRQICEPHHSDVETGEHISHLADLAWVVSCEQEFFHNDLSLYLTSYLASADTENVEYTFLLPSLSDKGYKYCSGFSTASQSSPLRKEEIPVLSAVFVEEQVEVRSDIDIAESTYSRGGSPSDEIRTIQIELGIWLSGVESFLASAHHSFLGQKDIRQNNDSSKEFRLLNSVLQRCAMLNARVLTLSQGDGGVIGRDSARELATALRESLLLSEGLIGSSSLGSGEWKAWSGMLSVRFRSTSAFPRLIALAEEEGHSNLPGILKDLTTNRGFLSPEHSELALVLPRFGVILQYLSVVGRMLDADEPLKPSLVIFSRVNEQIVDLTQYINNRLERFPNEEAELFGSLDAASYTASIELKKVYSQELAGVAQMRPTPSIYARIETAHSLLKEGFQQILASFARNLDPEVDIFELFPTFHIKLEQSIALRRALWDATKVVQAAEAKPEKAEIEKMLAELRGFLSGTVKFLFYKDTETVERFAEEIFITKQNKDLVPLLHRFGAYLETLFGQVNLRSVLEKYPFDPNGDD